MVRSSDFWVKSKNVTVSCDFVKGMKNLVESLNIIRRTVQVVDTNVSVSAGQVEVLYRLCPRNAVECHLKLAAPAGIVKGIAVNTVPASDVSCISSSLKRPLITPHLEYLVK